MGAPEKAAPEEILREESSMTDFPHPFVHLLSPAHIAQGLTFPSAVRPHCGCTTPVPNECLHPF